jgi:hypothetical protein
MLLRENFAGIATGVCGRAPILGHFSHASLYPPVTTGEAVGLSREMKLSRSAPESWLRIISGSFPPISIFVGAGLKPAPTLATIYL